METKTKVEIGIGVFITLMVSGLLFLVNPPEGYDFHECDVLEGGMYCFKLSKINDYGLQTRCYWNESAPRRYKYCSSGWVLSNRTEIEGNEIILKDFEEVIKESKFASDIEAREYFEELMLDTKSEYSIINMEKKLGGDELKVYWRARIFKESNYQDVECNETECVNVTKTKRTYIVDKVLSSKVPINSTREEIDEVINNHATEFISNWKPNLMIEVVVD